MDITTDCVKEAFDILIEYKTLKCYTKHQTSIVFSILSQVYREQTDILKIPLGISCEAKQEILTLLNYLCAKCLKYLLSMG